MNKTREKIIECGYSEFYKHGFQGASISSILSCASTPKGSLYHHFKSKKDLAFAVINEKITPSLTKLFDSLDEADLQKEGFEKTIFDLIDKIASHEHIVTYGCPLNKLIQEMVVLDKEFDKILTDSYTELLKKLTTFVEKAVDLGVIKTASAESLSTFLFQSVWGYISISPSLSSKEKFLDLKNHLHIYFKGLD